jgi:hypothetical protein
MICYVTVPSRLIGIKTTHSTRDKLTATVVGGAVGGVVCAPPYLLGRIGLFMLGSKVLFIPGDDRTDYKAPSGDNPHLDEAGLPLLGRRRGAHR